MLIAFSTPYVPYTLLDEFYTLDYLFKSLNDNKTHFYLQSSAFKKQLKWEVHHPGIVSKKVSTFLQYCGGVLSPTRACSWSFLAREYQHFLGLAILHCSLESTHWTLLGEGSLSSVWALQSLYIPVSQLPKKLPPLPSTMSCLVCVKHTHHTSTWFLSLS